MRHFSGISEASLPFPKRVQQTGGMMKRIIPLGIVLSAIGMLRASASAGTIDASAVITAKPDGSDFDYTIKLTNTSGLGNDSIATFWFAWVPGEDFLPTNPLSVSLPTGWTDKITHGGSTDGYAIQFDALSTASDLAPGSSLTFGFKSADTPKELMGDSPFHTTFPVLTSFVYSEGPLKGDGQEILASFASVPEPSTLTLGIVGLASLAGLRLLRRKGAA
jgi:PEP-CTERM motif